jgi:hypothetical protein
LRTLISTVASGTPWFSATMISSAVGAAKGASVSYSTHSGNHALDDN